MNENEIVNCLINALSVENTHIIKTDDFTVEREANMIIVGIESTTQVYPTLPDYEHNLSVVIDCWISEDDKRN